MILPTVSRVGSRHSSLPRLGPVCGLTPRRMLNETASRWFEVDACPRAWGDPPPPFLPSFSCAHQPPRRLYAFFDFIDLRFTGAWCRLVAVLGCVPHRFFLKRIPHDCT